MFATLFAQAVIMLRLVTASTLTRVDRLPHAQDISCHGKQPTDEYRTCSYERWRPGAIVYTMISVVYGMFVAVVLNAYRIRQHLFVSTSRPSSLSCIWRNAEFAYVLRGCRTFLTVLFVMRPRTSWRSSNCSHLRVFARKMWGFSP